MATTCGITHQGYYGDIYRIRNESVRVKVSQSCGKVIRATVGIPNGHVTN